MGNWSVEPKDGAEIKSDNQGNCTIQFDEFKNEDKEITGITYTIKYDGNGECEPLEITHDVLNTYVEPPKVEPCCIKLWTDWPTKVTLISQSDPSVQYEAELKQNSQITYIYIDEAHRNMKFDVKCVGIGEDADEIKYFEVPSGITCGYNGQIVSRLIVYVWCEKDPQNTSVGYYLTLKLTTSKDMDEIGNPGFPVDICFRTDVFNDNNCGWMNYGETSLSIDPIKNGATVTWESEKSMTRVNENDCYTWPIEEPSDSWRLEVYGQTKEYMELSGQIIYDLTNDLTKKTAYFAKHK